jgi:RecA/RadA recombinase
VIEIYGRPHSGKSTLSWWLTSSVKQSGRIALMDTEQGLDVDYLPLVFGMAGFHGELEIISPLYIDGKNKGKPRHHSEMATEMADNLQDERYNAIIMDSLGMYIPRSVTPTWGAEPMRSISSRDVVSVI